MPRRALCFATVFALLAATSLTVTARQPARAVASAPEFTFGSPAARRLMERIRARAGLTTPVPIRLEGTMQYEGRAERDRWGITVRWPDLYQQRNADTIHTLDRGAYRQNAAVPDAIKEVAKHNVTERYGEISILLLMRPHVAGLSLDFAGEKVVDGQRLRALALRNATGPLSTVYVHATEDRLVGLGRLWAISGEMVDRFDLVRERQVVDGVELPSRIEQLTGPYRASIVVRATTGARATID